MKFKSLLIGDVCQFGEYQCVKISNKYDKNKPLNENKPNALLLNNMHYIVVSPNSSITLLKSLKFDC